MSYLDYQKTLYSNILAKVDKKIAKGKGLK